MPSVIVTGGGLAGLAASAALGQAGYDVELYEARPFLGGRATSYPVPGSPNEIIDNCQHVLLRCCVNLLDLYGRLGVADEIQFHKEFYFIEPGGRVSVLRAGSLPAPLHFSRSFLAMRCLSIADKISIGRAMTALYREFDPAGLDRLTMLEWLRGQRQTKGAIDRFWRPVLVSAVNEELDWMSALHGFQVFRLGFLSTATAHEMGVPATPLGHLYRSEAWSALPKVRMHLRCPVERLGSEGIVAAGVPRRADFYLACVPFERLEQLAPELRIPPFEYSPITGIHLWFDRPVTELPYATLLDRTIQWMFNKRDGRHIQLVVSASRSLVAMPRAEVIDLAVRELGDFFPAVLDATLEKAHVVKEVRATFASRPGLESVRPESGTQFPNVFLAGDWTRCGWPATMEGAVRSGYIAAEAITRAAGSPQRFLLGA